MRRSGVPQAPHLTTASPFDHTKIADIDRNSPPPAADGTLPSAGDSSKRPYSADWVKRELSRREKLRKDPRERFLLKVEGVTTPLLTRKHFQEGYVDAGRTLEASRQRRAQTERSMRESKLKLFAGMVGEMANHEKLRLVANEHGHVSVDGGESTTADDRARNGAGGIQAALTSLRAGRREPIPLITWMKNVNTAIDEVVGAPVDVPDLLVDEAARDWALAAEHSGVLTYTPIYIMGLELASARLAEMGIQMTADEIVLYGQAPEGSDFAADETTNTRLALLVGLEMLDNDTMVTRRYSKEFQNKALRRKRQQVLLALRRTLGGAAAASAEPAVGALVPWEASRIMYG